MEILGRRLKSGFEEMRQEPPKIDARELNNFHNRGVKPNPLSHHTIILSHLFGF